MLSELVTWVLKTYLGKYLDDFNPAQLSVALLTGEVELENVPIKKDALRSFGVPIQARTGCIGKIRLKVPVRQFRTARLCIEIERVYGVFEPKNLETLDYELEKTSEHEFKMELLDALEAKWRSEKGYTLENYYSTSYSSWLSYGTSIATDILENLELKISDVHLRYEDPVLECSGGIKLTSLSAHTCNSNWLPGSKESQNDEVSFKLIELKDLSVYWDKLDTDGTFNEMPAEEFHQRMSSHTIREQHRYLIHPLSVRAQCKREKSKQFGKLNQRPRLSAEILITEATISISDIQYIKITECINSWQQLNKILVNRLQRPSCTVSQNPLLWWKYAAQCHGFEYCDKSKQWSMFKENLRYIKLYKRLLLNPNENISREEREFKLYFERSHSYAMLKSLRSISWANVYVPQVQFQFRNNQAKSMLFHWFPNWRGWYKGNDQTSQNDTYKSVEEDILNAIEDSLESKTSVYSTKDDLLGCFTFSLTNGKLIVNIESDLILPAFEMNFQRLTTLIEINPKAKMYLIGVSLMSVSLMDMYTVGTKFPYLIKSQNGHEQHTKGEPIAFKKNFFKSVAQDDTMPWFQLQFENRPSQFHSEVALAVRTRNLDVYFNANAIEWLIKSFLRPFGAPKAAHSCDTPENTLNHTTIAEKKHQKHWSCDIDISAPRIMFAKDFFNDNTNVLIIDFGRLQLHKPEVKKKCNIKTAFDNNERKESTNENDLFMTPCSTPPGSEASYSDSPTLRDDATNLLLQDNDEDFENVFYTKIYHKYFVSLSALQVLVCSNQVLLSNTLKTSSNLHILDKFSVSFKIEQRIISTKDPEYPFLILHGNIPKLIARISEKNLSDCLEILYPIVSKPQFNLKRSNQMSFEDIDEIPVEIESKTETEMKTHVEHNDLAFKFSVGHIILELQSHNKSIAELQIIGAQTSFKNTTEFTQANLSVHGLLVVDAIQSFGSDFELLLASHRQIGVDSSSGRLQGAVLTPQNISTSNADNISLANSDDLFSFTPDNNELENDLKDDSALININIDMRKNQLQADSLKTVKIAFNNLDVIANQETIRELLEYAKQITFLIKSFQTTDDDDDAMENELVDSSDDIVNKKSLLLNFKTDLYFDFNKLNILIIRTLKKDRTLTAQKVATLVMSEAKIQTSVTQSVRATGSLGGLQIIDISTDEITHRRIFSVGKDPQLYTSDIINSKINNDLFSEIYNNDLREQQSNQPNALVFEINGRQNSFLDLKLRMASVYYTHCPDFIHNINVCIAQFQIYIRQFLKSLGNKAADVALGLVHHINEFQSEQSPFFKNDSAKITLDIIISSPVVVLPNKNDSNGVLVANLGKITAYNNQKVDENNTIAGEEYGDENINVWTKESYFVDIRNINIYSMNKSKKRAKKVWNPSRSAQHFTILHDTALLFKLTNNVKSIQKHHTWLCTNTFIVQGSVTQPLRVTLSRSQYRQLIDTVQNIVNTKFEIDVNAVAKSESKTEINTDKTDGEDYKNIFETKIDFSIPAVQINLKNESHNSIFNLLLRDFYLLCDNNDVTKNIKIRLKSVQMEDLNFPKSSSLRNMMDSSSRGFEEQYSKRIHISSSCPDLAKAEHRSYNNFSSIPSHLDSMEKNADFISLKKIHFEKIKQALAHSRDVHSSTDNLVTYEYLLKKSEQTEQIMIDFNCLNLTVSIEKWFTIINFFSSNTESNLTKSTVSENKNSKDYHLETEMKIDVRSLILVLVRNDEALLKLSIDGASFNVFNKDIVNKVEGRLGSLCMIDLTPFGELYREKFTTTGDEALYFIYESLPLEEGRDQKQNENLRKDAILKIKMSAVRYIHTKRFLMEVHKYIDEIFRMKKPVVNEVKNEETETKISSQNPTKVGLDIHAASPLILLPLNYHSQQLLVADLGELSLNNDFCYAENEIEILDVMNIDLFNTNIFAGERIKIEEKDNNINGKNSLCFKNFTVKKFSDNLISESCWLKLKVERNIFSETSHLCPNISVKGTLSKVNGMLTIQQYKIIKGFLMYNLGEPIDDVYDYYASQINDTKLTVSNENAKMETQQVWNVLSMQIHLENVSVLIMEPFLSNAQSLARINFIKSSLLIDSYSDGSQDIDLISTEILIMDSRQNNSVFKYILQPTKNSTSKFVQAEVHCRKRSDLSKYTVLLNNMRITAILDCLNSLKNFFQEEPQIKSSVIPLVKNKKQRKQSVRAQSNDTENTSSLEAILNITESEVILVEDLNRFDTNAIILKSTTVFSYKQHESTTPISVDVNHLEVFSCKLNVENESALSIIDPCSLNIEIRDNCVYLTMQKPLNIRLSYNDIKTFIRLAQTTLKMKNVAVSKAISRDLPDFDLIAPLIAMGFTQKESLYAMEISNNRINDAALWLTQQRVSDTDSSLFCLDMLVLNAKHVCVWIIDDCMDSDVPLVELTLDKLIVKQKLKLKKDLTSSQLTGSLEAITGSDYYNRHLSGWEPLIEPWECAIKWSCPQSSSVSNQYSVNILSKQLLKLNITTSFIELCDIVRKNWTRDYYSDAEYPVNCNALNTNGNKPRTPFVPFSLQNLTGEPLLFKTMISPPGGITRTEVNQKNLMRDWIPVQPDEILPFDFGQQTKLRHYDTRKLNLHQIFVQIYGWTLIGPVSIDKVGTYFRYSAYGLEQPKKARIVFNISLIGSAGKLVTVRSALKILNRLNVHLMLRLESKLNDQNSFVSLKPNDKLCMPLRWIDSLIYVRPFAEEAQKQIEKLHVNEKDIETYVKHTDKFNFTKCKISWPDCTKESLQRMHQSFTIEKSFYFIVEIKRERFPARDSLNLPSHNIFFLPPLKIHNMLCTDLELRISDQFSSRICASKSLDIHAINAYDSFGLSIEMDNYKSFGQLKIPMGHNGVVEPKLKMIDSSNRELYLRVSIQSYHGNGIEIYISAPIWLINRTGLPLIFRQEGSSQVASGQFEEHEQARVVSPLMFSYSDEDASPSLEVRLGKSFGNNNTWSQSFNLHRNIFYRDLKTDDVNGCYTIGIHVQRGRGSYSYTTFVKLSPRYELCNKSTKTLQFAQKYDIQNSVHPSINIISVPPGCNFNFHWPHCEQEPLLCVCVAGKEQSHWSKGFPIKDIQSLYINIRSNVGEMHFLRLEVILKGATYLLLFTDAHMLPPPIRIDNYSEVAINFWQTHCQPLWRTLVRPQSSLAYVLDDPIGTMSLQIEAPGGNLIKYLLNDISVCPLTYANFIYIAFKGTYIDKNVDTEDNQKAKKLVLGVRDKKVILTIKNAGDRSQLWLMNSNGQLQHEGSSPPSGYLKKHEKNPVRMVLDIDKSPDPINNSILVVRTPNKQRVSTQTWRIENGLLTCYSNMCVQVKDLTPGAPVYLGRVVQYPSESSSQINKQHVEIQKLRPGSGQLEIKTKMDGPVHAIQIYDVKTNQEDIILEKDPKWNHASIMHSNGLQNSSSPEYSIKVELSKGLSISLITRQPFEELAYFTFDNIFADIVLAPFVKSFDFKVTYLQIDNQLLEANCPVLLHTLLNDDKDTCAITLSAKVLPSPNKNAVIFEQLFFKLKPCAIYLEERLILKAAQLLGYGKNNRYDEKVSRDWESCIFGESVIPRNPTRYYFEHILIDATQIRFSVFTTPKLTPELSATKKSLGLTLINFEDALIELDFFSDKYHFETMDVYIKAIKAHYINQIVMRAALILASVDFLGNPLGFAYDLSEGVSSLIFEGSIKSLVKNVTHGISNSTAKLTETLSDSLGKVVLDDHDKETRHKILELQTNTSGGHLAAGIKGLGFGLLGGVTSIVRHTYVGAQTDGLPGFLSGLGKGLVGTVTKPIIGVLDLASETASAVRESSRSSKKHIPDRRRLPRCVSGAPGGLLPSYSYRQSKGQQYLYLINRRQFSEKLLSYEPNLCYEKEAKLRLLVSTEYVRVFSRTDQDPSIMFECHLSAILSCHPLTTTAGNSGPSSKPTPSSYIEISTNSPKITRPRIRCQSEEIAERAARYINYAKTVFDEREQSLADEL